jgi:hypothetical protein
MLIHQQRLRELVIPTAPKMTSCLSISFFMTEGEVQRQRFLELASAAREFAEEFSDDPHVVAELLRCARRYETLAELDALRLGTVEQWPAPQ